eukprot:scaffold22560_cov135-Cylindrotheca_fusiformis.AAC.73
MRFVVTVLSLIASASAGNILMDASGGLRLKIPTLSTSQGVVTVIPSPGTSSLFTSTDEVLSLESENPVCLTCRGATLSGTSVIEGSALSTSSLVSGAILIDGITQGDVEAGWSNSRHARTMTALFRARLALDSRSKQSLILCIKGEVDDTIENSLKGQARALFEATVAETKAAVSFDDMYDISVVSVVSQADAAEVMDLAKKCALENVEKEISLASALEEAHDRVTGSGVAAAAKDPPHIAQAFVTVGNALTKHSRSARAKIASWRGRVARGLWVEGFGAEAESLRKRIFSNFDSETLAAAGLPLVSSYRMEMRSQLTSFVDSSIRELFIAQVANVEKSVKKKFHDQLLRKLDVPAEDAPDENAAALRSALFSFENTMSDLEVPSLSLRKAKACKDMEAKLTDEVLTFADSPAAQIKRSKKVTKVTNKEKKPGQRSVDFGLDLVAMLRPDGYGNLQGFAGYQLGGNSITFGIHNDADDPQAIAQFGGVRPPLLRIQPKLRVDVEM